MAEEGLDKREKWSRVWVASFCTVVTLLISCCVSCSFCQVIIITLSSNYIGAVKPPGRFTSQDMMTYEEAHKSSVPAGYVAFQFKGNSFDKNQEFAIGDGTQSSGKERSKRSSGDQYYYNKPLQLNTNYRVFLRAFVSEVS